MIKLSLDYSQGSSTLLSWLLLLLPELDVPKTALKLKGSDVRRGLMATINEKKTRGDKKRKEEVV